jgi:type III restriction enzyme
MRKKGGESLIYQLFIEPKGRHLKEHDRWKESFLKEITADFGDRTLMLEDKKYRLTGVPFYNNEDENQFRASIESVLN